MDEIIDESFFTEEMGSVCVKTEVEVQKTGFENSFNERQVGSIAMAIEPINGNSSLDAALDRFDAETDLQAIPVEINDRVVGVIERHIAEESTNSALKRLVSKNCSDYVTECSFYVNCNDFIEIISPQANEITIRDNIHYFVVRLNNRSFYGIVSIEDINSRLQKLREEDLKKAEVIQKNLLKVTSNVTGFPFDVCTWNKMANSVGGDYYAAQAIGDNKYVVSCFDVSGKNVSAALLTVTVASFFTMLEKLKKSDLTAAWLLNLLDDYLKQVVPVGNFITGVICLVDRKNSKLEIYNCGHTNTYVLLGGEGESVKVASLKPTLPPFGMGAISENLKSQANVGYKMPIKMGLQVNLYSDGFTDMQNEEGFRFEDEKAKDFFKSLYSADTYSVSKTIEDTVNNWVGRTMLPDDITVINMRF